MGSGRRRRWCSDACRRRGWEERKAVERGVVHVRQVPVEPSMEEMVARVASSPEALESLLRLLRERAGRGELGPEEWDRAVDAVKDLAGVLDALYSSSGIELPFFGDTRTRQQRRADARAASKALKAGRADPVRLDEAASAYQSRWLP